MNILFAASEGEPFVKTGGLADIIGSLPVEIATILKEEYDGKVACVLPKYSAIDETKFPMERVPQELRVPVGDKFEEGILWVLKKNNGPKNLSVYFIENKKYFDRKGLYHEGGKDYSDNAERFVFFSRAVLEFCKTIQFKADIIHCHDWQTGLIPALLKHHYLSDPFLAQTKTVFTIHNLAYQGSFSKEALVLTGLPWSVFVTEKLEYFGGISTLKAGIVYADKVSTVSPTYAKEILNDPEMGKGMTGVIQNRAKDFSGILNGLSYSEWNPEKDKYIIQNYSNRSKDILTEKNRCKADLQKSLGLPSEENIPLIGVVSRLDHQKGFHNLGLLMEKMRLEKIKCQWAILGVGDSQIENELSVLSVKYPEQFKARFDFSPELAHKIYAGSDFFFMPSEFEPCGLSQMIALKYGTVPIVSPRGGLLDTVQNWNASKLSGTGFISEEVSVDEFFNALKSAINLYGQPELWKMCVKNGMEKDFSWGHRAKSYLSLYASSFALQKKIVKNIPFLVDSKMILGTVIFSLLFSAIFFLKREGARVLSMNQDALVVEVFSKTNLEPALYPLLEEKLRALPEVSAVVSLSPEESLQMVEKDPNLPIDPNWLREKKDSILKNELLLPWSYDLHLKVWDENKINDLLKKIEQISVGPNEAPAVLEAHYDRERWSYAVSLRSYLSWLDGILVAIGTLLIIGVLPQLLKWFNSYQTNRFPLLTDSKARYKKYGSLLMSGVLCGLCVHFISWIAYCVSFNAVSWWSRLGDFLPLQIGLCVFFLFLSVHSKTALQEDEE